MSEGANFLNVKKLTEFNIGDQDPMTLSVSYPLCVLSFSASHIVVYDVSNFTILHIRADVNNEHAAVVCADISPDKGFIVTGQSDGQIIIWSIHSKSIVFTSQTQEPVVCIAFLNSSTVVHSDSNGIVYTTQFSTKFFKKQITTTPITNLQEPLSCLATYKGAVYTSTSTMTNVFEISPTFRILWCDTKASLLFSFLNDSMARVVGHTVEIMSMKGELLRMVDFSFTPVSVAIVDATTTLALFNGSCELAIGSKRFKRSAPQGLSKSSTDKIFVVGNGSFNIVTLASVKDRVDSLVKDGNWTDAFAQIDTAQDIPNLLDLFIQYSKTENFDARVLFSTAERLNCREMITSLPFGEMNAMIVENIVSLTKMWPLNRKLIKHILESSTISNEAKTKFILNSPLMLCFADQIINESMSSNPILSYYICYSFTGDIKLALEIAFSYNLLQQIHESLNFALFKQPYNTQLVDVGIDFLCEKELKSIYEFDKQHMESLFEKAVSYKKRIQDLFYSIVAIIPSTSTVWNLLSTLILSKEIKVSSSVFPYVYDFIVQSENQNRESVLELIIKEEQVDLRLLLQCARAANLPNQEYAVIELLGDASELLFSLVRNKEKFFCMHLRMTITKDLKRTLLIYCRQLIRINADEFATEMWATNDPEFIKTVSETLSSDHTLQWTFLKKVFQDEWYSSNADEQTTLQFIKYLSKYEPTNVYPELMKIKSIPYDKLLPIFTENGIFDASLYVCQMIGDLDKALAIAKNGLLDGLMIRSKEVVEQTTNFLCSVDTRESENMWMECFTCFQLPLYAFKSDKEKMDETIELFSIFLKPMILVIDPAKVSDKFSSLFSFIPFKIARPIINAFFKAIRERNEFAGTLSNIKKDEAIAAQMNYGRQIMRGKIIDADRCGKCHKLLGTSDAFAAKCGHVFHIECSTDGWCPICRRSFVIPNVKTTITHSRMLQLFDEENTIQENESLHHEIKHTKHESNHDELLSPLVGKVVSQSIE